MRHSAAFFVFLFGCGADPRDLGGDEWNLGGDEWNADPESAPKDGGVQVPALGADSAACSPDAAESELTAELVNDEVLVNHSNVAGTSCSIWEVYAEQTADFEVTITYADVGDGCEDSCYWLMAYTLPDPPSGTWTIVAGDEQVQITLP